MCNICLFKFQSLILLELVELLINNSDFRKMRNMLQNDKSNNGDSYFSIIIYANMVISNIAEF